MDSIRALIEEVEGIIAATEGVSEEAEELDEKMAKLGSGGRFKALVKSIQSREGYSKERASKIAAAAGRAKWGAKRMAKMSAAGRK